MNLFYTAIGGAIVTALFGAALLVYALLSGETKEGSPSPLPKPKPVPKPSPEVEEEEDDQRVPSGRVYSERDFYALAKKYPDYLYRAIFNHCQQTGDDEMMALAVALYERHFLGEEIAEKWGLRIELNRKPEEQPAAVEGGET